jgi:hypothetical protein
VLLVALQEKELRMVKVGEAITGWERPYRKSTAEYSVELGECAVSLVCMDDSSLQIRLTQDRTT